MYLLHQEAANYSHNFQVLGSQRIILYKSLLAQFTIFTMIFGNQKDLHLPHWQISSDIVVDFTYHIMLSEPPASQGRNECAIARTTLGEPSLFVRVNEKDQPKNFDYGTWGSRTHSKSNHPLSTVARSIPKNMKNWERRNALTWGVH